jgi:hypothetical protein
MPTYVTRSDGTREPADEATIELPGGLDVRSIRVRWGEVSLFDADGREAVLIARGTHPGAGFEVQVADHVRAGEG